ncbi:MAG: sensor histidine kinase, partial [Clostridium sp.]
IDTTKIDSGSFCLSFVNYDIVKLVEDITLSTLPYIELKKLNIIFDTEIEQLEIKCDPYAIERIILNLLSNAIKFTNDYGNINVLISIKDTYVCIKVNDDGIGIPRSMRDKIFEKFMQVDNALNRKKEGSGIGLSLVKSIVEMHSGRIFIDSTRMRGSEFVILLPNIKTLENYDKSICNSYSPNTAKISAEFSDIYELN